MDLKNKKYPSIYFRALYMKDVKCFYGDYSLNMCNDKKEPVQWTVILGNNNTGKTTILRLIASIAYQEVFEEYINKFSSNRSGISKRTKLYLTTTNRSQKRKNPSINNSFSRFYGMIGSPIIGLNLFFPTVDFSLFIEKPIEKDYVIELNSKMSANDLITIQTKNTHLGYLRDLVIFGYGVHRKTSDLSSLEHKIVHPTNGLFEENELLNVEDWLLQLDYSSKNGNKDAKNQLSSIVDFFLKGVLPDISKVRFVTDEDFSNFVEFKTPYGWVRLKDLGYGYQATIAWLADLAKRMFDRYSDLENPLHGPAIVLVDEIDLHLHPEWQRKIIKFLSDLFPNTQFIVTAHSPLIIQSAENVNLVMLEKDDEKGTINLRQQFGSFQGWTIEEILTELMDLGDRTRSDRYLELMRQFEEAVLDDNYEKAQAAYDALDKILSPISHQRKVLRIQMSSLIPA